MTDMMTQMSDTESCQLLTFSVGDNEYGVDIMNVREIKVWSEPTRLPGSPASMCGVINLRGTVVPIFDMRVRFNMGKTEITPTHITIIMMIGKRIMGILVDAVSDILSINRSDIRNAPDVQVDIDDAWVDGLISLEDRMVILLDTEQLFSEKTLTHAHDAATQHASTHTSTTLDSAPAETSH